MRFAYYCSGHGYGHATRVSAFASSLLSLDVAPVVYIVSSAPSMVFSECISRGALYRNADVDPVVVQPLAYQVDRRKSLDVLNTFLSQKKEKLTSEVQWLISEQIDCVLSDAAFLACEAANHACIPSILITNFTFDSVYSYLGAETKEPSYASLQAPTTEHMGNIAQDDPIPEDTLAPLVSQLLAGYSHADVLFLLPGYIPIPSFFQAIPLPAPAWVDSSTNRFKSSVENILRSLATSDPVISPSIPFPDCSLETGSARMKHIFRKPQRLVKYAPLLVRPASVGIHTLAGRSRILSAIGIPENFHDPTRTRILVVSFGGQKIRRPYGGTSPSRAPSPVHLRDFAEDSLDFPSQNASNNSVAGGSKKLNSPIPNQWSTTRIFIPGAPPVTSPIVPEQPKLGETASDGTPISLDNDVPSSDVPEGGPSLLPSSSWIAIICGVSSNWSVSGDEEALPAGFYVAPVNVYLPDLTAIADVLMGKLGYGTVSECIAQGTPLVYVPRPLFVEEHGLRLFLEAEGVGVELSQCEYESGAWASKVQEAYRKSKKGRHIHRDESNAKEVEELARWVVNSVEEWKM